MKWKFKLLKRLMTYWAKCRSTANRVLVCKVHAISFEGVRFGRNINGLLFKKQVYLLKSMGWEDVEITPENYGLAVKLKATPIEFCVRPDGVKVPVHKSSDTYAGVPMYLCVRTGRIFYIHPLHK